MEECHRQTAGHEEIAMSDDGYEEYTSHDRGNSKEYNGFDFWDYDTDALRHLGDRDESPTPQYRRGGRH